jgi:hypothetical protein
LEGFVKAPRIAASVILAVGIALGTAGCNLTAPQTTTKHYDASDGVSGTVGDVDVRNVFIVSDDGTVGNLVFTLVNNGASAHLVTIQTGAGANKMDEQVAIDAGKLKPFGGPNQRRVLIQNLNTQPGALYPVYFQYADKTGVRLLAPVLDSSMPEYADYAPTSAPLSPANQ